MTHREFIENNFKVLASTEKSILFEAYGEVVAEIGCFPGGSPPCRSTCRSPGFSRRRLSGCGRGLRGVILAQSQLCRLHKKYFETLCNLSLDTRAIIWYNGRPAVCELYAAGFVKPPCVTILLQKCEQIINNLLIPIISLDKKIIYTHQ